MRWRVLTISSVVPFLLASLLCLRSFHRADYVDRYNLKTASSGGRELHVMGCGSASGAVFIGTARYVNERWSVAATTSPAWRVSSSDFLSSGPTNPDFKLLGFKYWNRSFPRDSASDGTHLRGITIPYWFLLLALSIAPAKACQRLWRQRQSRTRVSKGLCRNCGYDLRASSTCCPECGSSAKADLSVSSART